MPLDVPLPLVSGRPRTTLDPFGWDIRKQCGFDSSEEAMSVKEEPADDAPDTTLSLTLFPTHPQPTTLREPFSTPEKASDKGSSLLSNKGRRLDERGQATPASAVDAVRSSGSFQPSPFSPLPQTSGQANKASRVEERGQHMLALSLSAPLEPSPALPFLQIHGRAIQQGHVLDRADSLSLPESLDRDPATSFSFKPGALIKQERIEEPCPQPSYGQPAAPHATRFSTNSSTLGCAQGCAQGCEPCHQRLSLSSSLNPPPTLSLQHLGSRQVKQQDDVEDWQHPLSRSISFSTSAAPSSLSKERKGNWAFQVMASLGSNATTASGTSFQDGPTKLLLPPELPLSQGQETRCSQDGILSRVAELQSVQEVLPGLLRDPLPDPLFRGLPETPAPAAGLAGCAHTAGTSPPDYDAAHQRAEQLVGLQGPLTVASPFAGNQGSKLQDLTPPPRNVVPDHSRPQSLAVALGAPLVPTEAILAARGQEVSTREGTRPAPPPSPPSSGADAALATMPCWHRPTRALSDSRPQLSPTPLAGIGLGETPMFQQRSLLGIPAQGRVERSLGSGLGLTGVQGQRRLAEVAALQPSMATLQPSMGALQPLGLAPGFDPLPLLSLQQALFGPFVPSVQTQTLRPHFESQTENFKFQCAGSSGSLVGAQGAQGPPPRPEEVCYERGLLPANASAELPPQNVAGTRGWSLQPAAFGSTRGLSPAAVAGASASELEQRLAAVTGRKRTAEGGTEAPGAPCLDGAVDPWLRRSMLPGGHAASAGSGRMEQQSSMLGVERRGQGLTLSASMDERDSIRAQRPLNPVIMPVPRSEWARDLVFSHRKCRKRGSRERAESSQNQGADWRQDGDAQVPPGEARRSGLEEYLDLHASEAIRSSSSIDAERMNQAEKRGRGSEGPGHGIDELTGSEASGRMRGSSCEGGGGAPAGRESTARTLTGGKGDAGNDRGGRREGSGSPGAKWTGREWGDGGREGGLGEGQDGGRGGGAESIAGQRGNGGQGKGVEGSIVRGGNGGRVRHAEGGAFPGRDGGRWGGAEGSAGQRGDRGSGRAVGSGVAATAKVSSSDTYNRCGLNREEEKGCREARATGREEKWEAPSESPQKEEETMKGLARAGQSADSGGGSVEGSGTWLERRLAERVAEQREGAGEAGKGRGTEGGGSTDNVPRKLWEIARRVRSHSTKKT